MISSKTFFLFFSGFFVAIGLFFSNIQDISSTFFARRGGQYYNSTEQIKQEHLPEDSFSSYNKKQELLYEILGEGYYDKEKVDLNTMKDNALKGFVEALGDPHTEYLTKEENVVFDESMEGTQHFEGIGAVVSKKRDGIMISEILKGSPAFVAGLQPLDILIQIEGESTSELTLSEAVKKIRGPKGSVVNLSVYRQRHEGDEIEIFDVQVTRGTIDVPSVAIDLIPYTGGVVAHIQVSIFGEDTIVKLQQSILQLTGSYDAILLDLRGNGGGYLPTAVELASFFLPKNEIVTTTKYTVLPDEILRSEGYGVFEKIPTIVLIDGMSASASEIVAGALKQRSKVSVMGVKSFGKGSIQTIKPIEDGSMLKYTIGKWYLPNNENIDEIGLSPDIEVPFDRDLFVNSGVDTQLQKALELFADPTQRIGDQPCCGNSL